MTPELHAEANKLAKRIEKTEEKISRFNNLKKHLFDKNLDKKLAISCYGVSLHVPETLVEVWLFQLESHLAVDLNKLKKQYAELGNEKNEAH